MACPGFLCCILLFASPLTAFATLTPPVRVQMNPAHASFSRERESRSLVLIADLFSNMPDSGPPGGGLAPPRECGSP